jgi:hypothetical protein
MPWQRRARGEAIDAARYAPAESVPGFPDDIARSVECWNEAFAVDFFACRAALRDIARATLDEVSNGVVLAPGALPNFTVRGDDRVFFVDDDDWFAPDTAARLAVCGDEDVAVFPLLRLDVKVHTFVRQVSDDSPVIGEAQPAPFRYQTNNYALHARLCTPQHVNGMADHVIASATAETLSLRDAYHDVMVSATNKTPVSAGYIGRILVDEAAFRRHVAQFIATLRMLTLPLHADWMTVPIRRTAALFTAALGAS